MIAQVYIVCRMKWQTTFTIPNDIMYVFHVILSCYLGFRDWLEDGITTNNAANRDIGYAPGTLEYCMMNNVQLQAWGSLAQGKYTGATAETSSDKATADLVAQLAGEYQTTPEAIVLAWLMRHPANIAPVLGSTNVERIKASQKAMNVHLTREHWYKLFEVARGQEMP